MSSALQPGHACFSLVYARQRMQFIPHGAMSVVGIGFGFVRIPVSFGFAIATFQPASLLGNSYSSFSANLPIGLVESFRALPEPCNRESRTCRELCAPRRESLPGPSGRPNAHAAAGDVSRRLGSCSPCSSRSAMNFISLSLFASSGALSDSTMFFNAFLSRRTERSGPLHIR